MNASYLRIKNWSKHQHYDPMKRRPPWIKFYNDLTSDGLFCELGEIEQWQLVRIWLVASRSTRYTTEPGSKYGLVPVVANDALTLQRAIQSAKRVPLVKFVRDGWLIPVDECELVDMESAEVAGLIASMIASPVLAPVASAGASAPLGTEVHKDQVLLEVVG